MDSLTRMRAFISVVEAEGFSAAARKIGRSKALLSKYVRELEDELGTLLLNRTTRRFSLTEAGHIYFHSASQILREIDGLRDRMQESAVDLRGRLKLSVPRSFADASVGNTLIAFARQHPDLTLELHLDDRLVDLIEEGFDMAIRISKLEDSSMIAKKLAPMSTIYVASPQTLERHGTPAHPSELTDLPCIVDTNSRNRNNWQFLDPQGQSFSVTVSGLIEANSPELVKKAALADLGITHLPDFIAREDIAAGRLVPVLREFTASEGAIYAVYPHRRYLPAKVRALVDFLSECFRDDCPPRPE